MEWATAMVQQECQIWFALGDDMVPIFQAASSVPSGLYDRGTTALGYSFALSLYVMSGAGGPGRNSNTYVPRCMLASTALVC